MSSCTDACHRRIGLTVLAPRRRTGLTYEPQASDASETRRQDDLPYRERRCKSIGSGPPAPTRVPRAHPHRRLKTPAVRSRASSSVDRPARALSPSACDCRASDPTRRSGLRHAVCAAAAGNRYQATISAPRSSRSHRRVWSAPTNPTSRCDKVATSTDSSPAPAAAAVSDLGVK